MKKLMLVAGAAALLVAAPAPATTTKTVAMDISKAGFVPASVSIVAGDSVSWTNKDTANHQVVCKTCPFTSPVLAPGGGVTFQFTKTGNFAITDPLNHNKKATVKVAAAPATVTASPSPRVVTYGAMTTIAGTLSTGQAKQKVDILAQRCSETAPKSVATVTTGAGGAFTYQTPPTINTSYQARFGAGGTAVTSPLAAVSTRPLVNLRRNAAHRFTVQVTAGESFVGKAVTFQRWIQKTHRWQKVKTVVLRSRHAVSTPLTGSTVSSVTFGARLRSRLSVRAVLTAAQASPCYIAASSATIRS
jgi:plastocyanin